MNDGSPMKEDAVALHTPTAYAFSRKLEKWAKLQARGKEEILPSIFSVRESERETALQNLELLGPVVHHLPYDFVKDLTKATVEMIANEMRDVQASRVSSLAVRNAFCSFALPEKSFVGENITTKAFRAWAELNRETPQDECDVDARGKWIDIVGSDGYLCDPEVFFRIEAEFFQNNEVDTSVRARLLGLLESVSQWPKGKKFYGALLSGLEQASAVSFGAASNYLEIIREMYHRCATGTYDPDIPIQLRALLGDFLEHPHGGVLLQMRAEDVARELRTASFHFSIENKDPVPFRFDEHRFCFHRDGRLYITEPESYDDAKKLIEVFNKADDESSEGVNELMKRVQEAVRLGKGGYAFSEKDDQVLAKIRQVQPIGVVKKLTSRLRGHPFELQDLHPLLKAASEQDLRDFEYLMRPATRSAVRELLGVEIESLERLEKYYFLQYIKTLDPVDVREVHRFVNAYGKEGIRALLVMEHDPEFARELVWHANIFLEGVMSEGDPNFIMMLQAYSAVLDSINLARDVYRERIGHEMSQEEYEKVGAALRERATDVLRRAVRGLFQDIKKNKEGDELIDIEGAIHEMQNVEAELVVFTTLLRSLDIDPRAVKGGALQKISGGALKGMFREQADILRIQEMRYRGREGYSDKFVDGLAESLKSSMMSPETEFYVYFLPLQPQDSTPRVGGCFRLDHRADEQGQYLYLGSVLLHPKLEGGKIIERILEDVARSEGASLRIKAHCNPAAGITLKYIEWGLVARDVVTLEGVPSLEIEYSTERIAALKSVAEKMSKAQLMAIAEGKASAPSGVRCYKLPDAVPDFSKYIRGKQVVTRYFKVSLLGKTNIYIVTEQDHSKK